MIVDIAIPVWNNWEWTEKCLAALRKHTPRESYRLLLIDNGSDKEVADKLRESVEEGDSLYAFKKNVGYIKAANVAMRITTGDLLMMNNDVIVGPGWLEPLVCASKYGIVSPVNNASKTLQSVTHLRTHLNDKNIPDITEDNHRDALLHMVQKHKGRVENATTLAFFCVLLRRSTIEALGPFDEIFGWGEGEDRDYCIRALEHGIKLGVALDSVVYHACHKSFDKIGAAEGHNSQRNTALLKEMYPSFDMERL